MWMKMEAKVKLPLFQRASTVNKNSLSKGPFVFIFSKNGFIFLNHENSKENKFFFHSKNSVMEHICNCNK